YIGEKPVDLITLDIYPYGNSSYTMYEDDGKTYNYETGAWVMTKFDCSIDNNQISFTINPRQSGGGSYTPDTRDYMLKVHNRSERVSSVELNGIAMRYKTRNELSAGQTGWYQEIENQLLYVRIYDTGYKNIIHIN
ncbi:MAG: alpha-glucosidase, partial [Clostridiales bacterium]|nr:alpha-glucosidase [Clostridiales bacterium]